MGGYVRDVTCWVASTTHTFKCRPVTNRVWSACNPLASRSEITSSRISSTRGSVCSALGRVAFSSVCCLVVVVDDVDVVE